MDATLKAKIKVLESNYSFLQKEHDMLIKGLHEEIDRLQKKYSELAFDYTMRSNKSLETVLLEEKIKQLELCVNAKNEEIDSQKDNLKIVCKRYQDEETKLIEKIEEQKKTIDNLQDIIAQQKDVSSQSEKIERPRKETQHDKVHKRKKKKPANSCAYETGGSPKLATDNSSINVLSTKTSARKSSKSDATSCTSSPHLQTIDYSASENENNQKKGRKEGHKRGRKKSNSSLACMGDVPILPSDYRAVVATLPPIPHSCEESSVECEMHNFVPSCSSAMHSGYSAIKSDVNPLMLSQLHKGLRKSSLKVESFN